MRHALIMKSREAQVSAANEAADWLLDAVACATQDRRFLRGEPEYDHVAGEAIIANGIVACLRAMHNLEEQESPNDQPD